VPSATATPAARAPRRARLAPPEMGLMMMTVDKEVKKLKIKN
jgi:hypothetical protein